MKVLSIDWGTKKMGLAIGDTNLRIAFPYQTVAASDIFDTLRSVMVKEKIEKIIVGLPLRSAGEETETSKKVSTFAEELRTRFTLAVDLVDERMTTQLARRYDAREISDDMIVAQILLQEYFDKQVSL